ncbi:MAG TPA: hypothetical protein VHK06_04490 [Candidatus Limnocylindria bacterium]|nr:hypothetical protein [Candidatus Limnocylindria bacterium]
MIKGQWDSDYFWHLTTGELIVRSGEIPRLDPYSFTWGGEWTTHEWLSEVAIFALVSTLGVPVTLGIFGLLPPLALGLLAVTMLRQGVATRAVVVATLLAGLVLIPYVAIRPQVISWTMVAALLALLIAVRPATSRLLGLLPLLFVLWANLHGLYVIGLGIVGLYCLFTLIGATPMAPARLSVLAAAVASFAASALTPAGIAGLWYPLRYLDGQDWGLAHIPEWQSPNFHDAVQLPLLGLIVALALTVERVPQRWIQVLALGALVGALFANRNIPVLAVASMPALAIGMQNSGGWLTRRGDGDDPRRRLVEVAAAAAVAAGAIAAIPASAGARGLVLDAYPVLGVRTLIEHRPDARVVAEYGWGGYVISQLFDRGGRVFVDGRNDMYPEQILRDYSALREGDPGWEEIVSRHRVEAMLFPPEAPIVTGIAQLAGWCEAQRDATQVLLLRECG